MWVVAVSLAELDEYVDADFDRLPLQEIARFLRLAELAKRLVDSMVSRAVPVFDARGGWDHGTHTSMITWLRIEWGLTDAQARSIVRTARVLHDLPQTAAMLAAGQISHGHAEAIATLVRDVPVAAVAQAEPSCSPPPCRPTRPPCAGTSAATGTPSPRTPSPPTSRPPARRGG